MSVRDVVYIVGPDSDHMPELRYSLRSVAANLPHRNIVIVGHCPTWVRNVTHVPTVQSSRVKYRNAVRNILAACDRDDVSDTFTLFNDDFYAMRPALPAPVAHRGTLHDMLNVQLRGKNQRNNDYVHGLALAKEHLESIGVNDPLSYELHSPLPIDKARFADIVRGYDLDDLMVGVAKRSLYGNLAGIGGTRMDDPRPLRFGYWEWDWISSNDDSFRPGLKTRTYLEHRFPEPCYYEDARTAPRTKTRAFVNTAPEGGGRIKVLESGSPKGRALLDSGAWLAV